MLRYTQELVMGADCRQTGAALRKGTHAGHTQERGELDALIRSCHGHRGVDRVQDQDLVRGVVGRVERQGGECKIGHGDFRFWIFDFGLGIFDFGMAGCGPA